MYFSSLAQRAGSIAGSALLAGFGLVMLHPAAAVADTAPAAGTPATVSADALSTWQLNGVVWSQVVVGNTVYATGSFTKARPPGAAAGASTEIAANNIFAYDITTGNPVTSFNHSLNAQGNTITASPDGSRVYVGGDFTTVDGIARGHIAAFSTADNSLVSTFAPTVSARVGAIAVSSLSVYIGGDFFNVNGFTRTRLAQLSLTGTLSTTWRPTVDDNTVSAMVLTPDGSKVIVGGRFTSVNSASVIGMGALDATTGSSLAWAANQTIQDGINAATAGSNQGCGITSLRSDGTYVYGSGYSFACGNFEGSFKADPATGSLMLANDCHGDTYDVAPIGGVLYTVSHAHDCSVIGAFPQTDSNWSVNQRRALAFTTTPTTTNNNQDRYGWNSYAGLPASSLLQWYPSLAVGSVTGQAQAAWSVAGNSKYVVVGGEFPTVNGTAQSGLTRFAVTSIAPNKRGPQVVSATAAPNPAIVAPAAKAMPDGSIRVTWQSAVDQDNAALTYNVYRGNATTPAYTVTSNSNFWTYPTLGFRDSTNLTVGKAAFYTIKVSDPSGNTLSLGTVSATPTAATAASAYTKDVLADGASSFWPLNEASGTAVFDYAGFNDATAGTATTRGAAGPIAADPSTASTFGGTDASNVVSPALPAPPSFSLEAWVKTTSSTGGKVIGYGGSPTGDSSNYDRQIYLDNAGRVWFGVYNGATSTANSAKSYNDGQWHHIVASQGSGGLALWVDGIKVASNTSATTAQSFSGYWRIGGDNLNGWPGQPTQNDLTGSIADVAVYPTVLAKAQVQQHFTDSGRTLAGPAVPTDTYGKTVYDTAPDLFWRLNETAGTAVTDYSGNLADGVTAGGITRSAASGVTGGGTAYTFDGATGTIASTTSVNNPTVYSEELWFKTTTTRGGKLIGFGDAQSGFSANYDRHVYMLDDGTLVFGTYTGQLNLASSTASYNDGTWHYLVATQGPDGMKLYVDNALVATNAQTSAQSYTGYWRVGGDTSWGGSSSFFAGTIDEPAVYSKVLTTAQIAAHYNAGKGIVANAAPKAAFVSSTAKLRADFDGSGSTDSDGTVASYSWDFGDTTAAGTGVSPSHTYAAAGTYTVKLTVTDNGGATDTVSKTVTVVANQAPTAAFTATPTNLVAAFDASTSSDPDGTVASYAWDFGDNTAAGTGVSPSHTYAAPGTFSVVLTVTDNDGATTSLTKSVTVTRANQAPTAAFTATPTNLVAAFDASTSSDPDGTVASYAWDFGDTTAAGTGVSPSHTYAAAGTYTVKLTVTDNGGLTGTTQQSVTVTRGNQAPTAAFTATPTNLVAAFDASGSTDPDGTVASYSWDFGDTTAAGTGVSPSHTYAAAGTYTVKLTVTDNSGATGTISKPVTVAAAASALAQDAFTRTVSNGWGSADVGGAWTARTTATSFSVANGVGTMTFTKAGASPQIFLPSISSTATDTTVTASSRTALTGGGTYLTVVGRDIVNVGGYAAKVQLTASGGVTLGLYTRDSAGVDTALVAQRTVTGLTVPAGGSVKVRFVASGTNPTVLRAKVWLAGSAEPTAWTATATDATAALQVPGRLALIGYLSSSSTSVPAFLDLDDLTVATAQ